MLGRDILGDIILGSYLEEDEGEDTSKYAHGQAQADIKQVYYQHGQANCDIKQVGYGHGQCQALISSGGFGHGQCQGDIKQTYYAHGQANCDIKAESYAHGQCQGLITNTQNQHGQAQASIEATSNGLGQSQGFIQRYTWIKDTYTRITEPGDLGFPDIGPPYQELTAFWSGRMPLTVRANGSIGIVDGDDASFFAPVFDVSAKDIEFYIEYSYDTVEDATFFREFYVRITSNTFLEFGIFNSGGFRTLIIGYNNSITGFIQSTLVSADDLEAGETYVLKGAAIGTTAKIKHWNKADPEPNWELTTLVHQANDVPGQVSPFFDLAFDEQHTLRFDNLNVYEASPFAPDYKVAQARASIKQITNRHAQARAFINKPEGHGQAQADIKAVRRAHAQARAIINVALNTGQAQSDIKAIRRGHGQAQGFIRKSAGYGQAQGYIFTSTRRHGQARAVIVRTIAHGQAQASIKVVRFGLGQARAFIQKSAGYGQAQGYISAFDVNQHGQAQGILNQAMNTGQAQASISVQARKHGQAQAHIEIFDIKFAQCQAQIKQATYKHGQCQAFIKPRMGTGQCQAYIEAQQTKHGQCQAYINAPYRTGQAQGYIVGKYLVNYNGYELPGYAQFEAYDSELSIEEHYSAYENMSLSEHFGLRNKLISLRMKVLEDNYYESKQQIQKAATILRTKRDTFAPLYIQRGDRYYEALAKKISMEATARQGGRTVEYIMDFEAKPWLVDNRHTTISGTGLIDTDQVSRTIEDGGWTPTTLTLTGTDITISGYTSTGSFAGFVSVSGFVSDLTINTGNSSVILDGTTANQIMNSLDYDLYVGPGKTFFQIDGATACEIRYRNRWYL